MCSFFSGVIFLPRDLADKSPSDVVCKVMSSLLSKLKLSFAIPVKLESLLNETIRAGEFRSLSLFENFLCIVLEINFSFI